LTTYNNSLLGKDAVSLKEKVTCVDEHQKDVGLGHTTYTPAIKDCYTQNQIKALEDGRKSFEKRFSRDFVRRSRGGTPFVKR
jgi:hypothetical protein